MKNSPSILAAAFALALVAGCNQNTSDPTPTAASNVSGEDTVDMSSRGTIPFSDTQIFFEFNSTANDAGIQVFLDAEGWKELEIRDTRGREMIELEASGGMKKLGLTELRFEGAEPEPQEVLDTFPAGEYKFRGTTVDRYRLVGEATLSHEIPPAPEFTPANGEVVDPDDVVIQWKAIGGIETYQVIVESDANELVLEISLSGDTTELHVPPTFLEPNLEYKVEVLAIAPSGNRTITEGTFVTGP
jgi:hypothetical protein